MEDWKYRLQQTREKKYPKKTDFAKLVGVSNATVTDWEKSIDAGGIKEISGPKLTRVCEVLNVDPRWLLHGEATVSLRSSSPQQEVQRLIETKVNSSATDDVLKKAAEMIETYRLANPAERRRIDYAFRRARDRIDGSDKAKPSTS